MIKESLMRQIGVQGEQTGGFAVAGCTVYICAGRASGED